MNKEEGYHNLNMCRASSPEKFVSLKRAFSQVRAGDRIFVGTGCGEPQYLVGGLVDYLEKYPNAFFDTEVMHVWTLGVAPYTHEKFKSHFRHNSFFIGENTREAVNRGMADYTPVFLSAVPQLFRRRMIPLDVALIQVSLPDAHGYFSLGVSVDIVKAAVQHARTVIVQVNAQMPRIYGNTFIHINDINFLIVQDEPLLEYKDNEQVCDEVTRRIGGYVSQLIEDGDTIQIGYGCITDAVMDSLLEKKQLGIHTELLGDGAVDLMKKGIIDNSCKTLLKGKTVASFCMGSRETYDYLDNNPAVEFHPIDFTNNPLTISRIKNMVAINSALELDLTGQATAESMGHLFYSGIGGQVDFMRGTVLSRGGKSILTLPSTSEGGKRSCIVPLLQEGAGITHTRGDSHYVVTEYGIAYLHGNNLRERAMSLIGVAHPDYRPSLIAAAKNRSLVYQDQVFPSGKEAHYPLELETKRTTRKGLSIFLRPAKVEDEPRLKQFFGSLTDQSIFKRFLTKREDFPHEVLQDCFVTTDYTRKMVVLVGIKEAERDLLIGVGQYTIVGENTLTAESVLVIHDDYQNAHVGSELFAYMNHIAGKRGIISFTAVVLPDNKHAIRLIERMGFTAEKRLDSGVYVYRFDLNKDSPS
ncbi:MAG: GNAT family N-acetyltransferase [Syntrophales bacterium]|nr:GNAT family N-acetyltransferase [Syntrophales bacterium]